MHRRRFTFYKLDHMAHTQATTSTLASNTFEQSSTSNNVYVVVPICNIVLLLLFLVLFIYGYCMGTNRINYFDATIISFSHSDGLFLMPYAILGGDMSSILWFVVNIVKLLEKGALVSLAIYQNCFLCRIIDVCLFFIQKELKCWYLVNLITEF